MTDPASELILLLPEQRRFVGQAISPAVGRVLARADVLEGEGGEKQQLQRHFEVLPRGWPMAAMSRQSDVGDARGGTWLRADPVHVRPDINGVRLMAWGNLELSMDEAGEFLQPLRPLFGDAGYLLSAPVSDRWYLMLPPDAPFPAFSTPTEGLGEDLLAHLPDGAQARRWRVLLTEAQVLLHNHPRNAQRIAEGLLPVNSVWFWGGGRLPDAVRTPATAAVSMDAELLALARLAGLASSPQQSGSTLLDLRAHRDWAVLERGELAEALGGWKRRYGSLRLDFSDGRAFRISHGQQWRLLRSPVQALAS